ncbi:MAG: hypothetical protein SV760_05395, partial [Halobacteria archaeon]|nr:hypothetical protein [Halobacteria archaeon]
AGAEVIQLDEPSLTDVEEVSIPRDKGVGAVERACEGVDADVVVQTYFGDVSDVYPQLLDVADGVGVDLVSGGESEGEEASAAPNLEALREHGAPDTLAVGCIDSRNTRLETFDEVSTSVDEVLDAAGEGGEEPSTVHVTPNCGLDFLPWNVMQEKVERTGEAVEKIDKEV